jgi:hypothetical protein
MPYREPSSVAEILETDGDARRMAQEVIEANATLFGMPAATGLRVNTPRGVNTQ